MGKTWPLSCRMEKTYCGAFFLRRCSHGAFICLQVAVTLQFGVFEISKIREVQSLFRFSQWRLRWWLFSLIKCFIQRQIWAAARWKSSHIDNKLQQHGCIDFSIEKRLRVKFFNSIQLKNHWPEITCLLTTENHQKSGGLRIVKPLALCHRHVRKSLTDKQTYMGMSQATAKTYPWPEVHRSSCKGMFPTCIRPGLHLVEWTTHCGAFLLRRCSHSAFIWLQVAVFEISEILEVQSTFRFSQCPLRWQLFSLIKRFMQRKIWTAGQWKVSHINKLKQHEKHYKSGDLRIVKPLALCPRHVCKVLADTFSDPLPGEPPH